MDNRFQFADTRPRNAGVVILAIFLQLLLMVATGCSRQEATSSEEIVYADKPAIESRKVHLFAVHPLHNPTRLFEVYQPLIDYLNARLGGETLRLEASSDYAAFEEKLATRKVEFALPNPYQTLICLNQGYRVFAKMGDDHNFRGVILVRKDSGIESPRQLVGKVVSYPAATALAAGLMPQWTLHELGLNVQRDIENRYVGTQESSIMSVLLGKSAAGATWPAPWRAFEKEFPDRAEQLKVMWETPSLINNSLVVRDDVPAELVERVATLLTTLHESSEGKTILSRIELSAFERADNATYEPVRKFIEKFEAQVRPLKAEK